MINQTLNKMQGATIALLAILYSLTATSCGNSTAGRGETDKNQDTLMTITNLRIDISGCENIEKGLDMGVSGAFVGLLNGKMIQAGGCNFPEDPLAPQSQKKFYEGIYEIELGKTSWQPKRIGSLPSALAYGMAVSYPDGIVLIGGSNHACSFSEAFVLKKSENTTQLSPLPPLPGTLDNFAATEIDSTIYVAGGNFNGKPARKVFCINLKEEKPGWKELPELPGNPRVQPVMAHSKNHQGKETLYLWGGFAGKDDHREASLNTDGLKFDFDKGEWTVIDAPVNPSGEAVSTGGGCAAIMNDGRIAIVGGVNKDIFLDALKNQAPDYLSHPIEWYRFNPYLLIFNPITEKWETGEISKELARAGAGMVSNNGCLMVSGGELKPRIRTAIISIIK